MWNKSISLPIKRTANEDSEGFENEEWGYMTGIRASFKDATRQDKILAQQVGYNASMIVEIAACVYNTAPFLIDESTSQIYDIKQTFKPEKSRMILLTVEKRENGRF